MASRLFGLDAFLIFVLGKSQFARYSPYFMKRQKHTMEQTMQSEVSAAPAAALAPAASGLVFGNWNLDIR